ncbi:3'-5' exonuclease, partial [Acinetobacter baumannii]
MKALILDTETNTLNGYPIEIAYTPFSFENGQIQIHKDHAFSRYFSCPEPIDLEAMAVHNIIEADIEGQPSCEAFRLPDGVEFIVGHNIDYDIKALNKCGPAIKAKTICTLALARDVWPELPSHKLAVLYYFIMSNREEARKHLRHAHSARADVYFTG